MSDRVWVNEGCVKLIYLYNMFEFDNYWLLFGYRGRRTLWVFWDYFGLTGRGFLGLYKTIINFS
eukprot:snap_masked-scaffold_15-processed-gene-2.68-mRNA-1 protein AED:1.00 eAED:1.00 QI:0/0/0/0/1/1/2/0/63